MSQDYDKAPAGGNSSFGNPNRPKDIQGGEKIETPPLDGTMPAKPDKNEAKPADATDPAVVHGSIGDGTLHHAP